MKKFSAIVLVFLAAMTLSACSAFYDDATQTYPQDEPFTATVFLQINDIATFSLDQLREWQSNVERLMAQTAADDTNAPKLIAATFQKTIDADAALLDTYTVNLTVSHMPAITLQKTVRPFKIYYTQTVYNPIALLPPSDTFTYVVGYTSTRRHSDANTDWVVADDDGSYIYLWNTGDRIEFQDVYPNRPLYYLLVVLCAAVLGGMVYLICRYNDCKKCKKPL